MERVKQKGEMIAQASPPPAPWGSLNPWTVECVLSGPGPLLTQSPPRPLPGVLIQAVNT